MKEDQIESQRLVALYFDRNDLGIACFDTRTYRIMCSSVRYFCPINYGQIQKIALSSSLLLLNHKNHDLFQCNQLWSQVNVAVMGQKGTKDTECIEHSIHRLGYQNIDKLQNRSTLVMHMQSDPIKFKALGLLLFYLLQESNLHSKIYFEDIEYFVDSLLHHVQISQKQLQSLEISKEDIHPSFVKRKGNSKEGYSLLSAYESFLCSSGSKKVLRNIFMNPIFDKNLLQQRYDIIEWMKKKVSIKNGTYFRNINVVDSILKRFNKMTVDEEDWRKLIKTIESMIQLRKSMRFEDSPYLLDLFVEDKGWQYIIELYHILKQTLELNPFEIKRGVDKNLDDSKKTYDDMPHLLTLYSKEQKWDENLNIIFMAQIGYLVKVPRNIPEPSMVEDEEWTFEFENINGTYFSNDLTKFLDEQYGDTYGEIQDIEKKIVFDLQTLIAERQSDLLRLYWLLCQIECYWGISQISTNMCKPKLSQESLIIANGWHMLLTDNVINNNSFSFNQQFAPRHRVYNSEQNIVNMNYSNRFTVVSGCNGSGKTVYLKQCALILYLAHVGAFVPAELAEIPLVDRILLVNKEESIYGEKACGFAAELKSLSRVLSPGIITNKSLILFDELGSEIKYEDSLRLSCAVITYLTSSRSNIKQNNLLTSSSDYFTTPITIMVTHLTELMRKKIISENYMIRFLTMDVEKQGVNSYKLRPGIVRRWYGIKMASEIMPAEFINISQSYLEILKE